MLPHLTAETLARNLLETTGCYLDSVSGSLEIGLGIPEGKAKTSENTRVLNPELKF